MRHDGARQTIAHRMAKGTIMTFDEILTQVLDLLQRQGRLSYRALKARFKLGDDLLDALKDELVYAQRVATDEDGRVLVWTGAFAAASTPVPAPASMQEQEPLAYTPKHLAEKILTSRSALEGERKQVTVLFCDLANSTTIAARIGPENMHALLNRFFDLALDEVHRYEGTINQFLGDGFMALFGAPIAHEDHARRAALAAVTLQRALHDYHLGEPYGMDCAFRMGLNTGLVVVGRIGNNLRMDYSAIGDTTNLAARLQQIAAPGTILTSAATHRLIERSIRLEALLPVQVKGKAEPVTPYKVIGIRPPRSPIASRGERSLSRFVGRERELTTLDELLAQVEAGQGHVVGIVAEAGGGKSRLLYEFRQRLAVKRVTYLEGRCLSYGRSIPYHPLVDLLRNNCGITEIDSPQAIIEKVEHSLQEVSLEPEEHAPYLLRLLGVEEGVESIAMLSPETMKTRTFATLRRMSLNGSQRQPLIFEIEDLHWTDRTSEEYLASLVESMAGASLLLLTTYRPGYRPPWLDKSYATQLALRSLATHDALSIVHSTSQQIELPDHVVQVIVEKGEGNPFFLEELTRAVIEHADFQADVAAPDTVQGVLMARIDRLPEASKRLLQTASVLGREFSPHLLEAIWDGSSPIEPLLQELKQLEFLYERTGVEGVLYVFKHALTQEVAYDSLLTPRRQALHTAAGRAIEAQYADRLEEAYDRLAYHYARTAEADKAVAYLSRFAEKAARSYAHTEALTALQESLSHVERLPGGPQDRLVLELTLRQAHSLYYLGRFPESLALLLREQERLERFQDPTLAGPYYFWLGHMSTRLGDSERAVHNAQRAVEEGQRCGDRATMGKAYTVLTLEGYWPGQCEQGIAHGRQAIALLEGTQEPYWLGMAYCFLGYNYMGVSRFALALEAEAQTRAIGEAIDDPRLQTYAAFCTGWFSAMIGEWDAAIKACQRSIQGAPDTASKAYASAFLGYAYLEQGDAIQALPLLEQAVQRFVQFQFRPFAGWFTALLAEAYRCTQRLEKAQELAQRGLDTARAAHHGYGVGWAQRALGRVAQDRGLRTEAAISLQEALQTFVAIQMPFETARSHLDLAALTHAQGSQESAAAHLTEAYVLFTEAQVPRYVERTVQLASEFRIALAAGGDG
jgi:class 3 adenylate cyclase/tetratricopeptide (TPR) repeat protein